ncbi:molybdenum ABC transporter [Arcobacter suis]|uniref:Quinolinate phosphoribosyltransferase-like protein n=1 Tax=Arcobacter suis CECT 7833 TaxID=663365 RepID=A0AAD0SN21_9BACT|nr:molybdenum ABC transporter [Arcobacter suis]AXX88536.1 quinolinate phosphoribosyltransferase-like protein [Arcobacter suis CECT 7833]RWS47630.1 molybdenum ABC transporter [Arcobacter suis]
MFNLTTSELEKYIQDDLPYFDLTTSLQNCNNAIAQIEVYTREDIIVSCSEEASKIAELLNCKVDFFEKSKNKIEKDGTILRFSGLYEDIHKAWRLTQILLEYSCKISTYAYQMKEKIEKINPFCELLTTRKTFPFSKRFCIKAAFCGGAMPHRLNLSETVLYFEGHRILYKNNEEFYEDLKRIKTKIPEKKLNVESESLKDSINLMKVGVDVIQLDKIDFEELEKIITFKNENFPNVKILVAGGINLTNIEKYASYKIDGVVTSSVYNCGMANISSRLKII